MKNNVLMRVVKKRPIKDILIHTSCEMQNEAIVCNAFITRLKNLNCERRFPTFHRTLNKFFGDQLDYENFLAWLVQGRTSIVKPGVDKNCHLKPIDQW